MARLMYASPAWWGYASEGERDRLEGFIRKTKRFGYLPLTASTMEVMSDLADESNSSEQPAPSSLVNLSKYFMLFFLPFAHHWLP